MQTRANRGYNRLDINQTPGDKRMATRCPYCQAKAYIRTSKVQCSLLRHIYYQCSNMQCGLSFRTTEEIDGILSEAFKPYIGIDLPLVAPPQPETGQLSFAM